jgi:DNA repair protein RadC
VEEEWGAYTLLPFFIYLKSGKMVIHEKLDIYSLKRNPSRIQRIQISTSKNAYEIIRKFYKHDINVYESLFLLMLDRGNITVGFVKISQGGVSSTTADMKMIIRYVTTSLASAIVIAHNHPSGKLRPSDNDIALTREIKQALDILEVKVLDHLILSDKDYYSFSDEGIL